MATGTGHHAPELPVWAGMGVPSRAAGLTSTVQVYVITDFEGKEQNWQNFPKERAPNKNVQSEFWRHTKN